MYIFFSSHLENNYVFQSTYARVDGGTYETAIGETRNGGCLGTKETSAPSPGKSMS